MTAFPNFDVQQFLDVSWQRSPLVIRSPWASWINPVEPDELAGLACEPGVESRLVTRSSDQWALEEGPLPETRFAELGGEPWTLLVQAVDHHVPAVAALLEPFRFIPNWRMDDVMVSYAADGGGVGAHFDQYDVFLVQGLGQRRWQVGPRCDDATPLLPHEDLRLLASFEPTEQWLLGPGDILYVPPGVSHNGVAVGDDCMTYSIGFRAPSRSELIADWTGHLIDTLTDDDRYADPGLALQANPGEISAAALDRLRVMIASSLLDRDAFAQWFGEYSSTPKSHALDWRPDTIMRSDDVALLAGSVPLIRNPASRFSFIRTEQGFVILFVDGRSYRCTGAAAALAQELCAQDRLPASAEPLLDGETVALLTSLINEGSVAFEEAG